MKADCIMLKEYEKEWWLFVSEKLKREFKKRRLIGCVFVKGLFKD